MKSSNVVFAINRNLLFPLTTIFCIVTLFSSSSFYQESWTFNWNEIRPKIKDSILLYEHQPITSGVGGEGVSTEVEVRRRLWIMSYATLEELNLLIKYTDGTIKAIAYEGLLRNPDYIENKALIFKAIEDKSSIVAYQSGCLGWDMSLGQYLVQEVLHIGANYPPPPPEFEKNFGLTQNEKDEILAFYSAHLTKE